MLQSGLGKNNSLILNGSINGTKINPATSYQPVYIIMTCVNATPITLSGATPNFGTYSGPGVVQGMLYPSLARPGLHLMTYTYTQNLTYCTDSTTRPYFIDECTISPTVNTPDIRAYRHNNQIIIEFPFETSETTEADLYSILGQLLMKSSIPAGSIRFSIDIPVHGSFISLLSLHLKNDPRVLKIINLN